MRDRFYTTAFIKAAKADCIHFTCLRKYSGSILASRKDPLSVKRSISS